MCALDFRYPVVVMSVKSTRISHITLSFSMDYHHFPNHKDLRFDIDLTAIRHFRVGLMSNRYRPMGLSYLEIRRKMYFFDWLVLLSLGHLWVPHKWDSNAEMFPFDDVIKTEFVSSPPANTNAHGPLTRNVKLRVAHAPGMGERFPRHRYQRKPRVSDPGMHHGTCVMHLPWCVSGSLTRGGRKNVSSIPGACATRNFTYLVRGPCRLIFQSQHTPGSSMCPWAVMNKIAAVDTVNS